LESFVLETEAGSIAVSCADPKAEKVFSLFGESLSLNRTEISSETGSHIILMSAGTNTGTSRFGKMVSGKNGEKFFFKLDPEETPRIFMRDGTPARNSDGSINYLSEEEWMWRHLSRLSALIGGCFFDKGGFLIHSGLVKFQPAGSEKKRGVLLAGASGSGKSTASGMFLPPWYSLSDDLTLIVKNKNGSYYAHPFPTWSRVLWKEDKVRFKSVDFSNPVELGTVIFIDRGPEAKLEPAGKGEALCLLTELVKQANEHFVLQMDRKNIVEFNKKYFLNLNSFVRNVNSYSYNLKIDNTFWKEVEKISEFRT